jgi:hypothetical protein
MTVTAGVLSIRRGMVQLKVPTGALQKLRMILEDDAVAHLDTKDLLLTGAGDQVTAKGHLYNSTQGKTSTHIVFASDVTIVKPTADQPKSADSPSGQKVAASGP